MTHKFPDALLKVNVVAPDGRNQCAQEIGGHGSIRPSEGDAVGAAIADVRQ